MNDTNTRPEYLVDNNVLKSTLDQQQQQQQTQVEYTSFEDQKSPEIIVSNASNNNSPMTMPRHTMNKKCDNIAGGSKSTTITTTDNIGSSSYNNCNDINDNTVLDHSRDNQSSLLLHKLQHCMNDNDDNNNNNSSSRNNLQSSLSSKFGGRHNERHSSINSLSSECSFDIASDYSDDGEDAVSPTEEINKVLHRFYFFFLAFFLAYSNFCA